jgi:nicotinamidase-related amidase
MTVWTPLPASLTVEVTTPQPEPVVLDPARTAVVVVDMQNNFCIKSYRQGDTRRAANVIPGVRRLITDARSAGVPVIYVQSLRQLESPEHTVFGCPLHLLVGSWDVEIVEEIAPEAGDFVVQKWSHDVWAWHEMEALLEREGFQAGEWTMLVAGVSASGCARAAAIGFCNRGYRTLIPMDATAASKVRSEARTFVGYRSLAYRDYIGFTLSTLVEYRKPKGRVNVAHSASASAVRQR